METAYDTEPLRRIAAARPIQVCAEVELTPAARALLDDDPLPSSFLGALLAADCHDDALAYLAHALPRADAVRWACDGVRALRGPALPAAAVRALAAAERWAAHPDPLQAQDAAEAAEAAGMKEEGAARFAALAAAWSADSLAPDGLPPAPPPPGLGALAVAAALMIAAATGTPDGRRERYRECLARGILVARAG